MYGFNNKIIWSVLFLITILLIINSEPLKTETGASAPTYFRIIDPNNSNSSSDEMKIKKDLVDSYVSFDNLYRITPNLTFFPTKLEHLIEIIQRGGNNQVIRVSGSGHTFNDISLSSDIIIRTFNLNKILDIDPINLTVTAETGIKLIDLNQKIARKGLAYHVLPAIPWQSLGGVIGTASHGSNYQMGTMSEAILELTVVLANGSVLTIDRTSPYFRAFCCSLGCLGIIYSVKIQCQPLYAMRHIREFTDWGSLIEIESDMRQTTTRQLDNLMNRYPYMQIYLYPLSGSNQVGSKRCSVYLRQKINERDQPDLGRMLLQQPDKTPITKLSRKTDIGFRVLTNNLEVSHYTETEVAIPFKYLEQAVVELVKLIEEHHKMYNYKTEYPFLIRFTKSDTKALLSPTAQYHDNQNDNGLWVYFDTYSKAKLADDDNVVRFFREFDNLLIHRFGGRPHWGKRLFLNRSDVRRIYKQNIEEFIKIRNHLDPMRIFTNDYIERIFQ